MRRTGIAKLPLHYGKAPRWLFSRMTDLAREIVTIIINEHGSDEFLRRISDPYWFQAFGCVLGYDWHSSGVTTVVTGALKNAIDPEEHGLAVCGGKGKASLQTPLQINQMGEKFGLSTRKIESLRYASCMSAKVDNTAIQDSYQLYHHAFIIAEDGKWATLQQGMCAKDKTARRYHWLSQHVQNFVVEPHDAIVGNTRRSNALNMTARESVKCQKVSTDIVKEEPRKTRRLLQSIRSMEQTSLQKWMPGLKRDKYAIQMLSLPRRLNWDALRKAYELKLETYEQLLAIKGVGPATIRALALIAELVFGASPSWKDPVKYSFAHGGKDGVPFPVNRETMDESIQILKNAIENTQLGDKEKLKALQRLQLCLPPNCDKS